MPAVSAPPVSWKKRLFPGLSSLTETQPLPVTAHWRRIFILPTAAGWFFGLSLLLMLVASLNFNNNMGLMLTFWIMGLAQVILLATFFNLLNVRLLSVHAEPVHAGERAVVQLTIDAPDIRPGIAICWADRKQNKSLLMLANAAPPLARAGTSPNGTLLRLPLPALQRGWQALPRVKIFSRYPAGLFTTWFYVRPDNRILVYPQPELRAPQWPASETRQGQQFHHTSSEHFDGVRPYQYGDPLRLVAWKRSAQLQDLVSREYHSHHGEHICFQWAHVSHLPTEQALSRLTAWVIRADDAGLAFRLTIPGFDSGRGQGHTHRHHCLRALALFGTNNP